MVFVAWEPTGPTSLDHHGANEKRKQLPLRSFLRRILVPKVQLGTDPPIGTKIKLDLATINGVV